MIELGLLFDGLIAINNVYSLGMILLGVTVGVVVGAIPGLTATMAISLATKIAARSDWRLGQC